MTARQPFVGVPAAAAASAARRTGTPSRSPVWPRANRAGLGSPPPPPP
jgi:hypothetical protein